MYKIIKYIFLVSIIVVGSISLKANFEYAATFWILATLLPIIGIILNKIWGYALACLLALFTMFALAFNGFFGAGDYITFGFSLMLVILTYPAIHFNK